MNEAELTVLILACCILFLIELILLLDSYSTFITGAVEIRKIQNMLMVGMIQVIIYFVEYTISQYDFFGSRDVGMLLNSLLYIGNLLYVIAFADFVYYKYEKKLYHVKVNKHLFLSPVFCCVLLCVANCFTPVFFDIAEGTFVYTETPWVILVNALPILYLGFTGVNDIKELRINASYSCLPISLYFLPTVAGIFFEFLFPNVPIAPISCALAMMVMYMRILKRIGYVDMLSGVFTRSQMEIYINNLLGKSSQKEKIAGIMLDVNRFKFINDTYGHTVGDIAIQTVGDILRRSTKKSGMCFRYGGDEFVVVLKITDVSQIEKLMEKINLEAKNFTEKKTQVFDLSISQGYAIFDTEKDSVITFVERMDAEMYKNKRASR